MELEHEDPTRGTHRGPGTLARAVAPVGVSSRGRVSRQLRWDYGTPSGAFITPGDNCWSGGGLGYNASTPCDHFGVGIRKSATKTTYSWLTETAPNSSVLNNGIVNLPAPVWNVIPAPPRPQAKRWRLLSWRRWFRRPSPSSRRSCPNRNGARPSGSRCSPPNWNRHPSWRT